MPSAANGGSKSVPSSETVPASRSATPTRTRAFGYRVPGVHGPGGASSGDDSTAYTSAVVRDSGTMVAPVFIAVRLHSSQAPSGPVLARYCACSCAVMAGAGNVAQVCPPSVDAKKNRPGCPVRS
ncbi:hypothetical protein D3C86_1534740 [compost metagenome]